LTGSTITGVAKVAGFTGLTLVSSCVMFTEYTLIVIITLAMTVALASYNHNHGVQ